MANKPKLSVIGGDTRQIYAADRLQKTGYDVTLTGFEYFDSVIKKAEDVPLDRALTAEILLLPLPFSKNGRTLNAPYSKNEIPLKALFDGVGERHKLFLGNADQKTLSRFSATGARVCDYFADEPLTLYNALLTAEGLLGLIIDKLPCAVFGSQAAVFGFGRIGFYLSRLLQAAGAEVTVFARSDESRAKARTLGLGAYDVQQPEKES
ncbi:MAG: hypothetical protein IJK98_11100, partial [Clostridia bacterium]|nr:hypothetical protein [Clostridia bacterium]